MDDDGHFWVMVTRAVYTQGALGQSTSAPWVCALQAQTQMKPMNSFDNENIRPHKFF